MSAATQIAGQASRMARCEAHGLDYPQTFFPASRAKRVSGPEHVLAASRTKS